jgi:hypothetical protein
MWFDHGLIGLCRLARGGRQAGLSASEVRRVLNQPASWADDRRLGLFVSRVDLSAGRDQWVRQSLAINIG